MDDQKKETIDLKHFVEEAKKTLSMKFKNKVRCENCPHILTTCNHRDKMLSQILGVANESA